MRFKDVEVRESGIQGWGLYALREFSEGETVLNWDLSHVIQHDQLSSLSEDERRYTHPLNESRILIVQAPERYVNHSCGNNTEVRDFRDVAIRPIKVGEEITSNYGTVGAAVQFECLCGNANCRRIIGAES